MYRNRSSIRLIRHKATISSRPGNTSARDEEIDFVHALIPRIPVGPDTPVEGAFIRGGLKEECAGREIERNAQTGPESGPS